MSKRVVIDFKDADEAQFVHSWVSLAHHQSTQQIEEEEAHGRNADRLFLKTARKEQAGLARLADAIMANISEQERTDWIEGVNE